METFVSTELKITGPEMLRFEAKGPKYVTKIYIVLSLIDSAEPEFIKLLEAQESVPRNRFLQPM